MAAGTSGILQRTNSPFRALAALALPVGLVVSVLVILIPMPVVLMDFLLAANIAIAVIILLTTIYVRTPLEFSIFPSVLLATTLARLVLSVATTRLILTRAETDQMMAAGGVIKTFGEFVAGDQLVVGAIIFAIIAVIQFVVITKGATRISEVAARFALDGMPGRQMAIDADLNAGIIHEKEAQQRRQELVQQSDFFGAMDGASKFIRGDAIASILITVINIVGGLFIGVVQSGMSLSEAASLFTKLSIGDGLVCQVPAFLTALAAGLLITRSSQKTDLPTEFVGQLFARPQALMVAGVFLAVLLFTGLPRLPLVVLGGGCAGLALMLSRRQKQSEHQQQLLSSQAPAAKQPEERIEDYLSTDPMEIEIGIGLIRLADPKRGGDLLERVQRVRQNIAADIGIIMPKVRIRDNMRLNQNQYRIKIADMPVTESVIYAGRYLAMDSGRTTSKLPGVETREPAFNTPAVWIESALRDQASTAGYTVVEPVNVLATHLTEIVRKHADEILTRDATKHLIDDLRQRQPAVVDELIPSQMKLGEVQRVLQMLLREQVPIRQLGAILETLGDYASHTRDAVVLTEYVRQRLARTICTRLRNQQGQLSVVTLDPNLEEQLRLSIEHGDHGLQIRMPPHKVESLCAKLSQAIELLAQNHRPPVVLVSPEIRAALKQVTSSQLPQLVVISFNEVTRDSRIESVAMVTGD